MWYQYTKRAEFVVNFVINIKFEGCNHIFLKSGRTQRIHKTQILNPTAIVVQKPEAYPLLPFKFIQRHASLIHLPLEDTVFCIRTHGEFAIPLINSSEFCH